MPGNIATGFMSFASNPRAKTALQRKLRAIFSICILLILVACNYPGRTENLIAGTSTMAAARQTAAAMLYQARAGWNTCCLSTSPTASRNSQPPSPNTADCSGFANRNWHAYPPYTGQVPAGMTLYYSQSGNTLESIAGHFRTSSALLQNPTQANTDGFLAACIPLFVPRAQFYAPYQQAVLSDSLVVYGRSARNVDVLGISSRAGGYLNYFAEYLFEGRFTGPEIVELVALETSTDPRLLLALIEYQSGWVYAWPEARKRTNTL